MIYHEFVPSGLLRVAVRCIWTLRGGASSSDGAEAGAAADPVLPDGSPELIFNLADRFVHRPDGGGDEVQPAALAGVVLVIAGAVAASRREA